MYTVRPESLRPPFEHEWSYDSFGGAQAHRVGGFAHILKRMPSYAAAELGYHTSTVSTADMSISHKSMELNLDQMSSTIPRGQRRQDRPTQASRAYRAGTRRRHRADVARCECSSPSAPESTGWRGGAYLVVRVKVLRWSNAKKNQPLSRGRFDRAGTSECVDETQRILPFDARLRARRRPRPVLVIKTLNAGLPMGEAERARLAVAGRQDVILIDEYLESDELTAFMARCTAHVSLHRAEGLGLTIAEAMAWGQPVSSPRTRATRNFTNDRNAFLVPCTMTAIPSDAEPYPACTRWAAPDVDQAAAILRRIVADPASATAVGRRAEEDIRRLHSPEVAALRMRESLRAAWERREDMLAHEARSARHPFLRRVRARIRSAVFRSDRRRR